MVRKIRLSGFAFAVTTLAAVITCGDKIDPLRAPLPPDDGAGKVTYTLQIKALFDQNCILCHSTENSGDQRNGAPISVNFNTYENAIASVQLANLRIQSGTMPPTGGLATEGQILFQSWIDAGTPK